MSVAIRPFGLDDYDPVLALWQNAGPGMGLGRSETRDEVAKKLQRDPDLFLVAEDGGRVIGTVIGGFDGRRGLVYHLAVEHAYRGRGIGTMLMDEVERRLISRGCLRCYLLVKHENEDGIEFYRHLGWQVMDIAIMAKTIA